MYGARPRKGIKRKRELREERSGPGMGESDGWRCAAVRRGRRFQQRTVLFFFFSLFFGTSGEPVGGTLGEPSPVGEIIACTTPS